MKTPQHQVIALFTLSLVLGGLLTSMILWSLSGVGHVIPKGAEYGVLAVVGVIVIAHDLRLKRFRFPQPNRQVPPGVFDGAITRASLRFGFELGTGFMTRITAGVPYFVVVTLILTGESLLHFMLAGVGFGVGRATMVWLRFWSRAGEAWDELLTSRLGWVVPLSSISVVGTVGFTAVFPL